MNCGNTRSCGTIVIDLKKDEEIVLFTAEAQTEFVVAPIQGEEDKYHYFGTKR